MLKNIKRDMAQHPQLALPNDPDEEIWREYELIKINLISFDDHLVIILQVPLPATFLVMDVYKIYSLLIVQVIL